MKKRLTGELPIENIEPFFNTLAELFAMAEKDKARMTMTLTISNAPTKKKPAKKSGRNG